MSRPSSCPLLYKHLLCLQVAIGYCESQMQHAAEGASGGEVRQQLKAILGLTESDSSQCDCGPHAAGMIVLYMNYMLL